MAALEEWKCFVQDKAMEELYDEDPLPDIIAPLPYYLCRTIPRDDSDEKEYKCCEKCNHCGGMNKR